MTNPLVLASGSPRRSALLAGVGLSFEIEVPGVDESVPPGTSAAAGAALVAARKCGIVAARRVGAVVIAADTVVILEGRALGKPTDLDEARAMLASLSGRTHEVVTAVCIEERVTSRKREFTVTSRVCFGRLDAGAIEKYLSAVHVLDKAGGYGIQESPELLGASVTGSVDNVAGLPLREVLAALREFGIEDQGQ